MQIQIKNIGYFIGSFLMVAQVWALEVLPENEIPLKLQSQVQAVNPESQTTKLFLTLFILIGLLAVAYFYIRKISYSNKLNKSAAQIKVLTQHHLGPKKTLAIVRVAGESILIGITDQNISMIKSLSLIDDEVPLESPVHSSFQQALQSAPVNKTVQTQEEFTTDDQQDDFSFAGIKLNVSEKLKSMKNIQ